MMNSKAQVFFFTLMLGIVIIIVALAFAGPVKDFVDSTRNETTMDGGTGLNCTSPVISDFDKATCIVTDLTIFHFIGGLIFIAGAVIVVKILF